MTLAQLLAEFSGHLRLQDVPSDVIRCAQDHLLDTIGVGLAARDEDAGTAVRSLVQEWGGSREATLLGEDALFPAASAALVNGTYYHAIDFDDLHNPSVIHPSAPLVAAVLAQAEASKATGEAALTALIAGYEVLLRLAMAQYDAKLGNSVFFEHGFHATSIIGAIGAAVACARLRGLDVTRITDALAISCSMGSGILEANRSGGSVKRIHCGWAAHAAVTATAMAANGISGPATVLEGGFGFFPAFCGDIWNPSAISDGLGERWLLQTMSYKPYPCNGFTHAIIDAALALKQDGLRAELIDHVEIGTAAASLRTIGQPIEEKRRPRTPYNAEFSAPFVFACAMIGGGGLGLSLEDFTEATINDPVRLELASRCDVVADEECTRVFPRQLPAVVRVRNRDGSIAEKRVMVNRGSPDMPLSHEELMTKLRTTAGSRAQRVAELVEALPNAAGVRELVRG
jgi:2-methylcitrate dehydratase PrpD